MLDVLNESKHLEMSGLVDMIQDKRMVHPRFPLVHIKRAEQKEGGGYREKGGGEDLGEETITAEGEQMVFG